MTIDASVQLLHTISEVLDIRSVFPRVSAIASQVLPHDGLGLLLHDEANRLTLQARSSDTLPEFGCLAVSVDGEFQIVNDLEHQQIRVIGLDPPDFIERAVAAGYRSLLNVRSAVPKTRAGPRIASGSSIGIEANPLKRLGCLSINSA